MIIGDGRPRGGAPVRANQRPASHNMERPVLYEYSNEPDAEEEDGDSEDAERYYGNELILQRSRNRHPGFSDDVIGTTSTVEARSA